MSSPFQQQALQRKIIYIVLIVVLFTVSGAFRAYVVEEKAAALSLREQDVGEVQVGSSAVQVLLTGSRGIAVCALWSWAIEAQRKNRWNEMELHVRSLTKLQPHFISPWLFQSWNLAYNVSVECDQVKDKYYFVSRGVELLAQGEKQNRNHPDLRHDIGMYYQHKIMQSDETDVFRCLFQLSLIPPGERVAENYFVRNESGEQVVDLKKFEKFCQDHPQLVRRLKERLKKSRPEEVLQFLADNKRIPGLYRDETDEQSIAAAQQGLPPPPKPDDERFPILPPPRDPQRMYDADEVTHKSLDRLTDEFDGFAAARAWYGYSQEVLPPPNLDAPGRPGEITNRMQQRQPRMTTIIFRSFPPRAQSYIGQRLEEEGWFDDEKGWEITDWFPDDRFSSGKEARVAEHKTWTTDAWKKAYEMWGEKLGRSNRLLIDPVELANLRKLAEKYWQAKGLPTGSEPPRAPDPVLLEEQKAARVVHHYDYARRLINFEHHYTRARVEFEPRTIQARKAFFEAGQLLSMGRRDQALERFERPDALEAWRKILLSSPEVRKEQFIQEDSYETQVKYVLLVQEVRGRLFKNLLAADRWLGAGLNPPGPAHGWNAALQLAALNHLPMPEIKPEEKRRFDTPGPPPDNEPMIRQTVIEQTEVKHGLRKQPRPEQMSMEDMIRARMAGMSVPSAPPPPDPRLQSTP